MSKTALFLFVVAVPGAKNDYVMVRDAIKKAANQDLPFPGSFEKANTEKHKAKKEKVVEAEVVEEEVVTAGSSTETTKEGDE